MKKRNWLLGISALLVATLTGCDSQITATLLSPPEGRTVHVTGSGSVFSEPDTALLNLGVSVEKETVAEAREEAASAMTTVLASLTANGIAETDIQTQAFNIYPQYDYTENGRVLRGYRVNNKVTAKVRELSALSQIIDDAAAAGGDIVVIESIQFMIEDATALQTQARRLAVKDAEAKAQTLASESGLVLGKPVSITETTAAASPPVAYAESTALAADSARTSTPLAAGELTVTVKITVVYEIE